MATNKHLFECSSSQDLHFASINTTFCVFISNVFYRWSRCEARYMMRQLSGLFNRPSSVLHARSRSVLIVLEIICSRILYRNV